MAKRPTVTLPSGVKIDVMPEVDGYEHYVTYEMLFGTADPTPAQRYAADRWAEDFDHAVGAYIFPNAAYDGIGVTHVCADADVSKCDTYSFNADADPSLAGLRLYDFMIEYDPCARRDREEMAARVMGEFLAAHNETDTDSELERYIAEFNGEDDFA